MSQYFSEQYECSSGNVKVELDYATYGILKGVTDIDTSMLTSKIDSVGFKTKLENLDVDELKTVPADLSKLSYVIDNDIVKNYI